MRYKGQKQKDVESRVGGIEVKRGYYYCAACESGSFPLDEQLELSRGCPSEGMIREVEAMGQTSEWVWRWMGH